MNPLAYAKIAGVLALVLSFFLYGEYKAGQVRSEWEASTKAIAASVQAEKDKNAAEKKLLQASLDDSEKAAIVLSAQLDLNRENLKQELQHAYPISRATTRSLPATTSDKDGVPNTSETPSNTGNEPINDSASSGLSDSEKLQVLEPACTQETIDYNTNSAWIDAVCKQYGCDK